MSRRSYRHWIATALAHALLADAGNSGGLTRDALDARAHQCLGGGGEWLRPLIDVLATYLAVYWRQHTVASLADHIHGLEQLDAVLGQDEGPPRVRRLLLRPARMAAPPFQLEGLDLPVLPTPADLAQWLDLPPERLQRLLAGLLRKVPVHESAHGFVQGRSVLSHAQVHAGSAVVLAFDLRDFFNSVGVARIRALWRTLGYPEAVAAALAALCTARTPQAVRERLVQDGCIDFLAAKRLQSPHLPQGAPTSPALANLCAFGLDLRLEGIAWRFGARYSRYADDLVFSGPAALLDQRRALHAWVEAVAEAEGFSLHPAKTRTMPRHGRQVVTGIVVNERPNMERGTYDRLRAGLHQLAATGADADTLMRLQGQLGWAGQLLCPSRTEKLRRLLAAIPLHGL
jgi:hypothetical protein